MKRYSYFLIIVSSASIFILYLDMVNGPFAGGGIKFIVWLISPYAYLALLNAIVSRKAAISTVFVLTAISSVLGMLMFAGSGMNGWVVIFTPIWQWIMLLLMTLPVYLYNKVEDA